MVYCESLTWNPNKNFYDPVVENHCQAVAETGVKRGETKIRGVHDGQSLIFEGLSSTENFPT